MSGFRDLFFFVRDKSRTVKAVTSHRTPKIGHWSHCFVLQTIAILLLMTGCKVGPKYETPAFPCVEQWKSPTCEGGLSCEEFTYWWEVFQDPFLDCLEMQAIENSPTVDLALERLYEACATANANIPSMPYIFLDPSYSNQIQLIKIPIPTPGVPLPNGGIFRFHNLDYLLPLRMTYEFDIWGRYLRQYTSLIDAAESQRENYHAAILSLTSDVATNYYNLRALDSQILLLEDTIQLFEEVLKLTENRFVKGYVSLLDVNNAKVQLYNALASLEETRNTRNTFENAIAVLIGVPASTFCIERHPLDDLPPPCIPPNLPSEVLLQRPDIAALERTMASEHEMVGYAYTSFFPSLSLTGAIGYSSPVIKEFLTWRSRYWALGLESQETIFDAGKNYFNYQAAWARFGQAAANYQEQVLIAFQEVEDSLTALEHQANQYELLRKSSEAAKNSFHIAKRRYSTGVSNYIDLLQAQNSSLDADINVINARGKQYISTIQLLKALGGTWETLPMPLP